VEKCGSCPVFASFTLAFVLQLRKKHGKPSIRVRKTSVRLRKTSVRLRKTSVRLRKTCQVKKNLSQVKKNLSQVKKNLSQVKKNLSQVKKNLSQSTVYILPKHPHITKPTQTHTLQNLHVYKHTQLRVFGFVSVKTQLFLVFFNIS